MGTSAKQKREAVEPPSTVTATLVEVFEKLIAARMSEERHVNYSAREWSRLSYEEKDYLIKLGRKHMVVIEVDGRALAGFTGVQNQIDYINKRLTR